MGYIFISYSRKQLYFAESVALHIQRAGFDIWFDLQKLGPGVDWASALQEGFNNCERLVFVASRAAIESPYVQVEWEAALRHGREVIVVLTEAVVLPEALRNCPVYDARTHFDTTIQSLIAYLRAEAPARHDPVPAPGRFPLPLSMPSPIWFTLFVMALPALTVWFATPFYPDRSLAVYLLGLGVGLYLLLGTGFAALKFWRHTIRFEELKSGRWNMLQTQGVVSLICFALLLFSGGEALNHLVAWLVLPLPLITIYWGFRLLGRSADLLRWFPSGNADQDVRETIHGKLVVDPPKEEAPAPTLAAPAAVTSHQGVSFAIHSHPADRVMAEVIGGVFEKEGCKPVNETQANTQIIILTDRTSKQWLLERNQTLCGRIIHILGTNIDTPAEIQPVLQKQLVDFRMGSKTGIKALAQRLQQEEGSETNYGIQVSPRGFNDFYAFPGMVWVVWWIFALPASILVNIGIRNLPNSVNWVPVAAGFVIWFLFDLLMMRKVPLPYFLHRITGRRLAWFASPGKAAKDPLGINKKSKLRLVRWGFFVFLVLYLSDTFFSTENS